MKPLDQFSRLTLVAAFGMFIPVVSAQTAPKTAPAAQPYKIIQTAQDGPSPGGIDYVFADTGNRRLYVPRSNRVTVFDLDTLKPVGEIPNTNGVHGAMVDPISGHGFSSSNPVVMWDAKTLQTIKTIPVEGGPDGILFEPATEQIYILSHRAPNVTAINAKDGSIAGTIDLGGAPEQAASDGKGRVYIDVEDKNNVAVVDPKTMQVLAHYDLGDQGGAPAGLALDAKNGILFSYCRDHQSCVILNAADGKIITTLPTGRGCDGAVFNPATMEAISSQGDGTLTVIKENSPTSFEVVQNVATKSGAKTLSLDAKTNQIYVITTEAPPAPAPAASTAATPPASTTVVPAASTATPAATAPATANATASAPPTAPASTVAVASTEPAPRGRGGRGGRGPRGPVMLDILTIGRQ